MWTSFVQLVLCVYFTIQFVEPHPKHDSYKSSARYYSQVTTSPRTVNKFSNNYDGEVRLRHQWRYPNLEKLGNRLNNLNSGRERPLLRHHGWRSRSTTTTTTEDSLFETYGELEGNEVESYDFSDDDPEVEDEDDNTDFDENTNFSDDDDSLFSNLVDSKDYQDVQAEEPTIQKSSPDPAPSSITQLKWEKYGTQEKVKEAKNKLYSPGKQNYHRHHFSTEDIRCKYPARKVVPVQSEHPNLGVIYQPSCVVLYRCADDTGCCNQSTVCSYKTRELVYSTVLMTIFVNHTTVQEKLQFYNHTECTCQAKSRNYDISENNTVNVSHSNPENSNSNPENYGISENNTINDSPNDSENTAVSHSNPENIQGWCRCPEQFVAKVGFDYKCLCECAGGNSGCIRMQKGEEFLSLKDRRCIKNNLCSVPHCEFGPYRLNGRCPTKSEKIIY